MGDSKYKEKIRHLSIINAVFVENKIMLMMKIILKKIINKNTQSKVNV